MSTNTSVYRKEQQITSVHLASISNISGTYYNGPTNNGVVSTLTLSASSLTIDSTVCKVGDRILLTGQTSAYQNGIYDVVLIDSFDVIVILQRSSDFQAASQIRPGYYISVSGGSDLEGAIFVLVEPSVGRIGSDSIIFVNNSSSNVTLPVTDSHFAIFDGTAGRIKDGGVVGQASHKAVSDNTQTTVACFNPTSPFSAAGNNLAVFTNDSSGTIQSSGYGLFVQQPASWTGGATSHAFTFTGMTGSAVFVWASLLSATNNVAITKVVPGTNIVTISFTADPGTGTVVNLMAFL